LSSSTRRPKAITGALFFGVAEHRRTRAVTVAAPASGRVIAHLTREHIMPADADHLSAADKPTSADKAAGKFNATW